MNNKIDWRETFRFRNPFKKEHCPTCGAFFDETLTECPNCKTENRNSSYARSFEAIPNVAPWREILLFLFGWLGFQLIGLIVQLIVLGIETKILTGQGYTGESLKDALLSFGETPTFYAAVNYSAYLLLFVGLLLLLWKDTLKLFPCFKNPKTYLGFAFGFVLMAVSVCWSLISSKFGATTNENQTVIIAMVKETPLLAILVTGLIGPLCEELAYRVGLFGFSKRINRILAYFVASVLFGLIHIHDFTSINEWLSFPDYLLSGLLLAFIYEKYGLGASWIAHATNNLVAVLQILLLQSGE